MRKCAALLLLAASAAFALAAVPSTGGPTVFLGSPSGQAIGNGHTVKVMPFASISGGTLYSMTVYLLNSPDGYPNEFLSMPDWNLNPVASSSKGYETAYNGISFTASGSPADYAAVLRTITYQDNLANPTSGPRTIRVVVSDGTNSTSVVTTVNVQGAGGPAPTPIKQPFLPVPAPLPPAVPIFTPPPPPPPPAKKLPFIPTPAPLPPAVPLPPSPTIPGPPWFPVDPTPVVTQNPKQVGIIPTPAPLTPAQPITPGPPASGPLPFQPGLVYNAPPPGSGSGGSTPTPAPGGSSGVPSGPPAGPPPMLTPNGNPTDPPSYQDWFSAGAQVGWRCKLLGPATLANWQTDSAVHARLLNAMINGGYIFSDANIPQRPRTADDGFILHTFRPVCAAYWPAFGVPGFSQLSAPSRYAQPGQISVPYYGSQFALEYTSGTIIQPDKYATVLRVFQLVGTTNKKWADGVYVNQFAPGRQWQEDTSPFGKMYWFMDSYAKPYVPMGISSAGHPQVQILPTNGGAYLGYLDSPQVDVPLKPASPNVLVRDVDPSAPPQFYIFYTFVGIDGASIQAPGSPLGFRGLYFIRPYGVKWVWMGAPVDRSRRNDDEKQAQEWSEDLITASGGYVAPVQQAAGVTLHVQGYRIQDWAQYSSWFKSYRTDSLVSSPTLIGTSTKFDTITRVLRQMGYLNPQIGTLSGTWSITSLYASAGAANDKTHWNRFSGPLALDVGLNGDSKVYTGVEEAEALTLFSSPSPQVERGLEKVSLMETESRDVADTLAPNDYVIVPPTAPGNPTVYAWMERFSTLQGTSPVIGGTSSNPITASGLSSTTWSNAGGSPMVVTSVSSTKYPAVSLPPSAFTGTTSRTVTKTGFWVWSAPGSPTINCSPSATTFRVYIANGNFGNGVTQNPIIPIPNPTGTPNVVITGNAPPPPPSASGSGKTYGQLGVTTNSTTGVPLSQNGGTTYQRVGVTPFVYTGRPVNR